MINLKHGNYYQKPKQTEEEEGVEEIAAKSDD